MKAVAVFLAAVLGWTGPGTAPAASQEASEGLVLTHAHLIDGLSADARHDVTVVVRGDRIEEVSSEPVAIPAGATVIDLDGRWLLPGLVDAHAHVRDLASARAALAVGVTTIRSMGVSHFVDVGIRALHRAGVADLPDVVAAGYHVRRRPAEELFLDAPGLHPLMAGIHGADEVRRVVRMLVENDVDVLKVMATERAGTPDTDPMLRMLTDEELEAAVVEASRAGRAVAAHAHTDEGARAAVQAGVGSIKHGTLLSDTTLALMSARGTCLVPTLTFWADMRDRGRIRSPGAGRARPCHAPPRAGSGGARLADEGEGRCRQ